LDLLNKEKNVINLIKYGAMSSIIIISIIIMLVSINEKNKDLNLEILKIEEDYLSLNKLMVENLVNKTYNLIELEKKFEKEDFDSEMKEEVYQAYSIAMNIYNERIKEPNYSEEKTINSIKNALKEIRFNNDGYLFLYKMNGDSILNTEFPNIEGKNFWEYQDSKGTFILKEMNTILQNKDETFYEWYWQESLSDKKEYKKIGFFKKIPSLNMFVGGGYYEKNFNKQTQKRILEKLNSFKLKDPEHIFLYDLNGLCLVNPKKELIGLNRYDVKNEDGIYAIRDSINFTIKNKEGFINYNSTVKLNDSLKSNDKISFLKLYEEWGWIIGSGFYLEEFNNKIKEKKESLIESNKSTIQQIISIAFIITIIMIFISFYLANIINNMFINYKQKIDSELIKTIEKEKMLIQQSKMATMGEMIGSIAHQWKQPLNLISISNGLLKINNKIKDFATPEEIINAIDNIDNSIHNLSQTIDDFRNFFNPNKEKIVFHISDAFEDTLKLINSQFKNNNIEIKKDIKDIQLLGYRNELLQVLINLLKNSKEELLQKPNLIKKYIFVSAYKNIDNIVIKIKDNAGGIPNEIISKIFDAYFTTKEKDGGTGIGLYISKQIIEESMKGKITVSNVEYQYENENYKGAEFSMIFPINLVIE
jgi:two-component system, NtrC family, sensor kinase